ncbi:hypothetical protein ACIBO1_31125 [Micromonospora sp. NPDC049903]|uniref:hypothetical protein n=1 Tax=Micromonospora sp. NPDC049903 TaxID=3364276 RepID=UPI0037B6235E
MRRTRALLHGVVAVSLGLGTAIPAAPAAAGPPPTRAQVADNTDYGAIIDILLAAAEMGQDGVYTPLEISRLIQQLIGAVNGAKVDLLTRLNSEVTNDIRARTEAAVTKVELLRVPWAAGPAINSTHDAAYVAKNHLRTVHEDDNALDAVGRAMIVLFTQLEAAYLMVDAEDGTNLAAAQRPYFRQGLEYLIQEMRRECPPQGNPNAGVSTYSCSFGGRSIYVDYYPLTNTHRINGGPMIPGPITKEAVAEMLMRDTALPLAQRTLDLLISRGVPLP